MKFEIFIDNQLLDGVKDSDIALSLAVNKFQDISSRQGDFTTTIEALRTPNNKAITNSMELMNTNNSFAYDQHIGEVRVNGLTTIKGYVFIEDSADTYKFKIFAGNSDWLKLVGEKQLCDLIFSNLNHTWDNSTVQANRMNTFNSGPLPGLVYPNINYGWWTYRSGTSVAYYEVYPAMYCIYVLRRIFESIGYYVYGELFDDIIFQSAILPFTKTPIYSAAYLASQQMMASQGIMNSGISRYFLFNSFDKNPSGSMWNHSDLNRTEIKPKIYGKYGFTINVNVSTSGYDQKFQFLKVTPYGTQVIKEQYLSAGANTVTYFEDDYASQYDLYMAYMDGTGFTIADSSTLQIDLLTGTLSPGGTVFMSDTLPKVSQVDFIRTIVNQFNVMIIADSDLKRIRFAKMNQVVQNKINAIDWSDKIDFSTTPTIKYKLDGYGQTTRMLYESDDKDITNYSNQLYGQGSLSCNNKMLDLIVDGFQSKFAPVLSSINILWGKEMYCFQSTGFYCAFIEKFAVGKDTLGTVTYKEQDVKPRIAYVVSTKHNLITVGIPNLEGGGYNTTDSLTSNLEVHFEKFIFSTGLIPAYYDLNVAILNNVFFLICKMRLRASDINQIDFTCPIYLNVTLKGFGTLQGYFYLNFVNQYKVNRYESTEVELIKIG